MSHTPNNISINILYEDPQIIVCVKPPGIATQSRSLAAPDMVRLLKKHLYTGRPAGEPYLAVIHRLDQPVSGILVFAKTPAAARELNRQLQASDSQSFGKYYRALTAKKPPQTARHIPIATRAAPSPPVPFRTPPRDAFRTGRSRFRRRTQICAAGICPAIRPS